MAAQAMRGLGKLKAQDQRALIAWALNAAVYREASRMHETLPPSTATRNAGRTPAGLAARDAWDAWLSQPDLNAEGEWVTFGDLTPGDIEASIVRRHAEIGFIEGEIAKRDALLAAFAAHPKAKRIRNLPRTVLAEIVGEAA